MPEFGWQLVVCGVIVGWAALILVRSVVTLVRGRSGGCASGSCGGCAADDPSAAKTPAGFVPLQALDLRPENERRP